MSPARISASVGYTLPTTHSVHQHLLTATSAIALETDGALELQLFPHESFGSDVRMLDSVFAGDLHFMVCTGPFLGRKVAAAAAPSVPFAFDDIAAVWRAVDGELGVHVRESLREAGVHAFLHSFDNGFRHLTTSDRAIREPEDVKGLEMRVVAAPLHQALWSALGAMTVACDIVEVHQLLASGGAKAQDNSLPMIEVFGLHEVQTRCALTAHMWEGFWIVANLVHWHSMPMGWQEIVSSAFAHAALAQRQTQANDEMQLRQRLGEKMHFNPVNRGAFREQLIRAGFYEGWRLKLGPDTWAALQSATEGAL